MKNKIKMQVEVSGHYKLEVRKANGDVRQTLEFDNLITNIGLERMGDNADWLTYCQVGTGSTAPVVGDTALVAWLAGAFGTSTTKTAQPSSPYYCATQKTYRFAAGVATGNISEVGVGWGTSGSVLFSRALILDGEGAPTTITVLSDETLDVTYECRQYIPEIDSSDTIILRAVSHTYTGRAAYATLNSQWTLGNVGVSAGYYPATSAYAYDGAIGVITSIPAGVSSLATSQAAGAYSALSFEREHTLTFGLTAGNFATGITAMKLRMGSGAYQFGFSPAIMKTDADELSITFKISWARKTL